MRTVGACPRLIDDVFTVGDEDFTKKGRDKISQVKAEGKTIVFVSHALHTVKPLCQGSLLRSKGSAVTIGTTEKVMNAHLAMRQSHHYYRPFLLTLEKSSFST